MTYVIGLFSSGSWSRNYAIATVTTLPQLRFSSQKLFSGGTRAGAAFLWQSGGGFMATFSWRVSALYSHCMFG